MSGKKAKQQYEAVSEALRCATIETAPMREELRRAMEGTVTGRWSVPGPEFHGLKPSSVEAAVVSQALRAAVVASDFNDLEQRVLAAMADPNSDVDVFVLFGDTEGLKL